MSVLGTAIHSFLDSTELVAFVQESNMTSPGGIQILVKNDTIVKKLCIYDL